MAEPGISPRIIRFGAFEIDLASAELRKHGLRVRIQEQPYQVLLALLERPGEVVTRDDLHRRLWPDDTFVDFEHGLNAAVTRLRQTLGDSAQTPRFVESVPRRGYRFMAPVEAADPGPQGKLSPETTALPDREYASQPAEPSGTNAESHRKATWHLSRTWVAVALFLAVATTASLFYFREHVHFGKHARDDRLVTFTFVPPDKTSFALFDTLTVSPDGRLFAFTATDDSGETHLWVRPLGASAARRLDGTESASFPFWSGDSRSIGFFVRGNLKRIDASGGLPQTICDAPSGRGGSWSQSGLIVFAPEPNSPLFQVSLAGDDPKPVTTLDSSRQEISHRWPSFLPDGKHFVYTIHSSRRENSGIHIASVDSKRSTPVLQDESNAAYVSAPQGGGNLLFARGNALMGLRFDIDKLKPIGEPFPIAQHVNHSQNIEPLHASFSVSNFSVSNPSALAYVWGRSADRLTWFDRSGARLQAIGEPGTHLIPSLSPDGRELAVDRLDTQTNTFDIWRMDVERGIPSRLTFDPQDDGAPVWSPDGRNIAFASLRSGIFDLYRKPSSGLGGAELLFKSDRWKFSTDWSPDGRFLLYYEIAPGKNRDVLALPLFGDKKPIPLLQTQFNELDGVFSPNGKWFAYSSDESGKQEIYVQRFRRPRPRVENGWFPTAAALIPNGRAPELNSSTWLPATGSWQSR